MIGGRDTCGWTVYTVAKWCDIRERPALYFSTKGFTMKRFLIATLAVALTAAAADARPCGRLFKGRIRGAVNKVVGVPVKVAKPVAAVSGPVCANGKCVVK